MNRAKEIQNNVKKYCVLKNFWCIFIIRLSWFREWEERNGRSFNKMCTTSQYVWVQCQLNKKPDENIARITLFSIIFHGSDEELSDKCKNKNQSEDSMSSFETFLNSLVQTHKDSLCFIHGACFYTIIYKTEVIVIFNLVDNGIDIGHND